MARRRPDTQTVNGPAPPARVGARMAAAPPPRRTNRRTGAVAFILVAAMLDIGKVLTPEQRAKLGERMKQRQAAMAERMQRLERQGGAPRN